MVGGAYSRLTSLQGTGEAMTREEALRRVMKRARRCEEEKYISARENRPPGICELDDIEESIGRSRARVTTILRVKQTKSE